ncbi:deoxynucleoside kinase-like [Watersipora subatra]|uniref:deoxynucleoside kinase-like n=1 Tax=Watersipora subatra TaxID=2589382 RepID=UPI00355C5858
MKAVLALLIVAGCASEVSSSGNSPSEQCPKEDKKLTVLVEGNIGAGKTTFLKFMQEISSDVTALREPVVKWQNISGTNAMEIIYEDPKRWSMTFQSYVQLTLLQHHMEPQTSPVKMMERSIFSAHYCFVRNFHNTGKMTDMEFEILDQWFQWLKDSQKLDVDLIIYLRVSPSTCLERLKKRSKTEAAGMPPGYLESLDELHEDWLIKRKFVHPDAPVLVIDANKDLKELQLEMKETIPNTLSKLAGSSGFHQDCTNQVEG